MKKFKEISKKNFTYWFIYTLTFSCTTVFKEVSLLPCDTHWLLFFCHQVTNLKILYYLIVTAYEYVPDSEIASITVPTSLLIAQSGSEEDLLDKVSGFYFTAEAETFSSGCGTWKDWETFRG